MVQVPLVPALSGLDVLSTVNPISAQPMNLTRHEAGWVMVQVLLAPPGTTSQRLSRPVRA